MKIGKLFTILLCLVFLSGCLSEKEEKPEIKEETKEIEKVEEKYVDSNTILVGLYDNIGKKFIKYNSYTKTMKADVDLDTYQIVFSNEDEVKFSGNRQDFIKSLWDSIEYNFTLGIILEYDTMNEGHIKHVIYKSTRCVVTFDFNRCIFKKIY